jgi:hypothetical protein
MRVLFCTDTYPPQVNGVSIVTALMVSGLSRLGWQCAVLAPRYPAAAHARWGGQTGPDEGPVELVTIPSVPLPRYPDVRLALPWIGPCANWSNASSPGERADVSGGRCREYGSRDGGARRRPRADPASGNGSPAHGGSADLGTGDGPTGPELVASCASVRFRSPLRPPRWETSR